MEEISLPPVPEGEAKNEDYEKLRNWYKEEITRKDRMIEELKKENLLLVRSALKTSERLSEMQGLKGSGIPALEKVRIQKDIAEKGSGPKISPPNDGNDKQR